MKVPDAARDLVLHAVDHGWSVVLSHHHDSGGCPFITVRAVDLTDHEIRLTWHTRDTGTYRLFSRIARGPRGGWRDVTLTRARELISTNPITHKPRVDEPGDAEEAPAEPTTRRGTS